MKNRISAIILLIILTALTTLASGAGTKPKEERTIPYPAGYDTQSAGASSYAGCGNHADSKYFVHPDVYELTSNKTLTVISRFKTYQQTTEVTCGPCAALMVLYHYGNTKWQELKIAEIMKTNQDLDKDNKTEPGQANERGEYGTSTEHMVAFFKQIGWKVTSSLTEGKLEEGKTFKDHAGFKDWVVKKLKQNTPVMVEWIDWLGHWQVIIGYDTMGTDALGDDVLILADPYDTSDHLQDGYYLFDAERFYYMWADGFILPESQSQQQWLIATPK
ncbi:MAG TPA: C39 family peptidase [Bacillota bacterium]|nr:C39 family peptidase [Bacillota bacterium]